MESNISDYVNEIMTNATLSSAIFNEFDQERTDKVVRAVYEAGFNNRIHLAKMAYEETGIGKWQDKVIKNILATQLVYNDIIDEKTVGIISDNKLTGIVEIAKPLGPILAVIPVTNPTSTILFKILICLKTRNPIIISPHRNAMKCSIETARICYEAAMEADAPEHCIQWIEQSSREQTHQLMTNKNLALILATGGGGLVHAAYSSGTPAIGVGAGNVPVFIEKTANIQYAVDSIIASKTFDNGTVCASEQAIVAEKCISEQVIEAFRQKNAYFLSDDETKKVENVAYDKQKNVMNINIIGKPATYIANLAGICVPPDTILLMAKQTKVGHEYPLSSEILAPILAFYVADNLSEGISLCIDLNYHGGIGHSASIFSNNDNIIKKFAMVMNAGRILVNMPSSQGAVGGIYNTLSPSLTLGCGTGGKNITTDNITARHLLNIQRITRKRSNHNFLNFDQKKYFDENYKTEQLEKEYNLNN